MKILICENWHEERIDDEDTIDYCRCGAKIKRYYYKENELYNIKKISGLNFLGHDLIANWKDKDDNNKEKLGNFYLKDLTTK